MEPNLEELMKQYQAADATAADALVDCLSPGLLRFFLMQEATRPQADDLLQETWLRVHRVRHTYRYPAPVLPWLFAIARHVRVDGYRRVSRIRRHESAMDVLPEHAVPEPSSHASLPSFASLMAELPESQREVVTLLKLNGLSLDEIARATSTSVGSVKQKASRAYAKLRSLLEKSVTG